MSLEEFGDAAAQAEVERGRVPLAVQVEIIRHVAERGPFEALPDLYQRGLDQRAADALTFYLWRIERGDAAYV